MAFFVQSILHPTDRKAPPCTSAYGKNSYLKNNPRELKEQGNAEDILTRVLDRVVLTRGWKQAIRNTKWTRVDHLDSVQDTQWTT